MTDIVGNETLRSWWDRLATVRGDKTFLIFQDRDGHVREYSYGSFNEEINKTANLFIDLGVTADEKVAVHMHTSPEFMMCLFGLAKIGAVLVPMNDQYLQSECEYVLKTCDIVAAVIDDEFSQLYEDIVADGFNFKKGLLSVVRDESSATDFVRSKDAQPVNLKEVRLLSTEDVVEILFTSGTTSRPKGVEFTHCNMIFSGIYGAWESSLSEDDRMLSTMPACHSNFQLAALTPVLSAGAALIAIEKYSASKFWRQIREYGATHTQCVSMMLRTLMLQPQCDDERDHLLREVLYFLPVATEEKVGFEQRFNVRLMNTYGSTESLVWVLTDPPTGERKWPSVGRVGLSYEVKIIDEDGDEVPPLSVGEITVKGIPGRTIMRGYHKDPEATAQTIDPDGWMHTGDKGYQDELGWFYFFDRKANMIKRNGENISTTEIETILTTHPKIAEAAVIGVPDSICDQAIKAFILPVEGETVLKDEVLDYCSLHMAAFKIPSFVEIREDFPYTCCMKIEKKLL